MDAGQIKEILTLLAVVVVGLVIYDHVVKPTLSNSSMPIAEAV